MSSHAATAAGPVRAFLAVSRCEFMAGGLFFLLTVSALVAGSWTRLWEQIDLVLWGGVMWYLSHLIGSQVNCLADQELDRTQKGHLSAAIGRIGRPAIWLSIAAESVLALLVVAHMVWLTGKWILLPLWIAGWVVAMAYSLEPLRFKRRGILNPLSLLVVLYVLPVAYGYIALTDRFDLPLVALFVAIGLQMLSLILLNEVEDIPEDRAHGIATPFVRYGLSPVSVVALALFSAGGLVALVAFAVLLQSWGTRLLVLLLGSAGYALILHDIAALVATSLRRPKGQEGDPATFEAVRQLGRRNPAHFAILGLTVGLGGVLSLQ